MLRACNTMRQPINLLSYLFPAFFSPPLSLLKKNKNKQTELDTFEVGNGVTFGMKQYCIEAPIPNWNNSMRSVCLKCKIKPSHSQYNFFIDTYLFFVTMISPSGCSVSGWVLTAYSVCPPSSAHGMHTHTHMDLVMYAMIDSDVREICIGDGDNAFNMSNNCEEMSGYVYTYTC